MAITIRVQGGQVQAAVPAPKPEVTLPKREVTAPAPTADPRESRVSHTAKKDATAAVRRARWRKKNPEQHRDQQRAARARRKAGAGS